MRALACHVASTPAQGRHLQLLCKRVGNMPGTLSVCDHSCGIKHTSCALWTACASLYSTQLVSCLHCHRLFIRPRQRDWGRARWWASEGTHSTAPTLLTAWSGLSRTHRCACPLPTCLAASSPPNITESVHQPPTQGSILVPALRSTATLILITKLLPYVPLLKMLVHLLLTLAHRTCH